MNSSEMFYVSIANKLLLANIFICLKMSSIIENNLTGIARFFQSNFFLHVSPVFYMNDMLTTPNGGGKSDGFLL